jgi:hypothetical protein
MESVCKNCDMKLKRSDCSDEEYVECETRRWIGKYVNCFNTDELVNIIESEFSKNMEKYGYDEHRNYVRNFLIDIASFCIDRSRHY